MCIRDRAWVIEGKDEVAVRKLDIVRPGDYEVLFKTEVCSLCTVDRRTYKGTRNYGYPFLGGHECSGTIIEIGRGVVNVKPQDKAIFTSGGLSQDRFLSFFIFSLSSCGLLRQLLIALQIPGLLFPTVS